MPDFTQNRQNLTTETTVQYTAGEVTKNADAALRFIQEDGRDQYWSRHRISHIKALRDCARAMDESRIINVPLRIAALFPVAPMACPCGDNDGHWCSLPGCPYPRLDKIGAEEAQARFNRMADAIREALPLIPRDLSSVYASLERALGDGAAK